MMLAAILLPDEPPLPSGDRGPSGDPGAVGDADPARDKDLLRAKLKKAPNAFRTISEVADELQIPQHVLRFWETKFTQVKPLKRGGGRRYYRPDDIALLRRVSDLLYTQGYTIKGVQRLLREGGGQLSDDIPPATEAERAAAAAERANQPDEALLPAESDRSEEVEALRTLLREVLAELEALRRLLP